MHALDLVSNVLSSAMVPGHELAINFARGIPTAPATAAQIVYPRLTAQLWANPTVSACYLGTELGAYHLVGFTHVLGPALTTVRSGMNTSDGTCRQADAPCQRLDVVVDANGDPTPKVAVSKLYDHRGRTWYMQAKERFAAALSAGVTPFNLSATAAAWSDPYVFATFGAPGITFTIPFAACSACIFPRRACAPAVPD